MKSATVSTVSPSICHLFQNFPQLTFIYVFVFGCAGSQLLRGFSPAVLSTGYSPVVILRLLIVVASLAEEHGLSGTQPAVVVAPGLLRSTAQAQ